MAKQFIKAGATDQTIDVFIGDSSSTTGAGLTGLVFNSASLVCYYRKGATGAATALTLATQTVGGAHSDGGFVEVSSANMPGVYRLDLSDAMVDTAGALKVMLKGAANMAPCVLEIEVTSASGLDVDVKAISGDAAAADNLESAADGTGYNLGGGSVVAASVTGNVGGVAAGGITASSIAADAIGASELAADAVAEIVAALLTTQMTEAYAADGTAPTLAQCLFLIQQSIGDFSISGTTLTVKKLDGSTTAAAYTLDHATTPTSRTRSA